MASQVKVCFAIGTAFTDETLEVVILASGRKVVDRR